MAMTFSRRGSTLERVGAVEADKLYSKIGQRLVARSFLGPRCASADRNARQKMLSEDRDQKVAGLLQR